MDIRSAAPHNTRPRLGCRIVACFVSKQDRAIRRGFNARYRPVQDRTGFRKNDGILILAKLLLLHGPNLNLLGTREPDKYGRDSLADINARCVALARELGHDLVTAQFNGEGQLIERIHAAAGDRTEFIIFNPAAYTHTSVALRDALLAVAVPFIEVHLSNVHAREAFRQHSCFSDVAVGTITGLGAHGYELAVRAACARLT